MIKLFLFVLIWSTNVLFTLCLPLPLDKIAVPKRVSISLHEGTPPLVPLQLEPSPPFYSPASHWHWRSVTYLPVRTDHPHGQPQLPHWYSGPWDRAWEMWNSVAEHLKIVKRSVTPSVTPEVRDMIAMHDRPKGWVQKLKDWWRRVTGRKLKVTRAQAAQVARKYRRPGQKRPTSRVDPTFFSRLKTGRNLPPLRKFFSSIL